MSHKISKFLVTCLLPLSVSTGSLAKGAGSYEMGLSYNYQTAKSPRDSYTIHELQGFLLRPYRAIWAGMELDYANNKNSEYNSKRLELGLLAKYWLVDPGGAVGLNFFSGIGFGSENAGSDPNSTMTIKAGPELAWFVSDGAAVSTKIQYASRRAGPTYTVIGLFSGISLFF